ncbi:uncharacterized protein V1516DRAFT_119756 [Lipomyces oligophaga]|uniref:uncharacterized protein n=1 Tax=Lipomyces oligophaga TaxID=45792 RepID=UPI0034CF2DA4
MPSLPPRYSSAVLPASKHKMVPSQRQIRAKSPATTASRPLELSVVIESPPLVCYGPPDSSTGALLSGLLFLTVNAPSIPMESVSLELVQDVSVRRPAVPACKPCVHRQKVLKRWDLLANKLPLLPRAEYGYPFSHLLAGDLPASTVSALATVSYSLHARATPADHNISPVDISRPISLTRSIISSDIRRCLRVFPPTVINVTASLPAIVFPRSEFTLELQLNNIVNREKHTRWNLRKLNWHLDEISKLKSLGCVRHDSVSNIAGAVAGTDSHGSAEDARVLSRRDIRQGWKTDFTGDGRIEMELPISTFVDSDASNSDTIACNVADSGLGFSVEHTLVIELLVSEEHLPAPGQHTTSPTGGARILRMQFAVDITERGGLGISWDDEVPPMYADVPVSPPGYDVLDQPHVEVEQLVV